MVISSVSTIEKAICYREGGGRGRSGEHGVVGRK